jgi:hypothetical protein
MIYKYEYLGLTYWWPDDSDDFAVAGRVVFELTGRDRATEFVGLPWTEKKPDLK